MTKKFKSAAAFKTSLETRMRARAATIGMPLHTQQIKFVMERLLARLFFSAESIWLLKGGFAMDLRYRPHSRTTKDVDLMVGFVGVGGIKELRDKIQAAAELDLGDFLMFYVGEPKADIANAPKGGQRFPIEAILGGKTYAKFSIDVGVGDTIVGIPEMLIGDDLLEFAGIAPAVVRAISKSQQFAEKLHAYSYPWAGRLNTRTKDLVDLVLLIERGALDIVELRAALAATFTTRATHPCAKILPAPPEHWKIDFPEMASEAALSTTDLATAFAILDSFWRMNSLVE